MTTVTRSPIRIFFKAPFRLLHPNIFYESKSNNIAPKWGLSR